MNERKRRFVLAALIADLSEYTARICGHQFCVE